MDKEPTTLVQMERGQRGTVLQLRGGRGLVGRLNALGILPGNKITKVSAMLMRGPVTVEVDRVQIAIGFGMANKIIVRPD
jgi:ferrous iron transport protein A